MTARQDYHLFETPLGVCAIRSSEVGISGLHLPQAKPDTLRRRCEKLADPALPPPAVAEAITAIIRHLSGELQDFSLLPLDLAGTPAFHRRVYEAIRAIPAGEVWTYGRLPATSTCPTERAP